MAQYSALNLPKDLLGNPIPMNKNSRAFVGGRSVLDNIYGASSDPRIQANPPSRFRTANMGGYGMMNGNIYPRTFERNFTNQNNVPNNAVTPVIRKKPVNPTPPNFQNNLLNYVLSPEGQGFAQGLLEASGYTTMPTTMGQALALASKRSDEAVDREAKKEQQEFLNLMKEKEFGLAKSKDEREQQIFDRSILRDDKSKEIFDSINKDDFDSDREYYSEVAKELLKEGYIAEGTKLAELGKPTSIKDFTKEIIGASKEEKKTFDAVKKGVDNFKQILDAAEQEGGASSYALMIKFIKQLDDSVVREGEVRTFGTFQGLYQQLKIEIDKFQGEGFPPEVKKQIVNLANKTVNRLVTDYETYRTDKSDNLYEPLGIPPSMVFAGYDLDTSGLDLTREYTEDDFSEDTLGFKKDIRATSTNDLINLDISNFSENQKIFYNQILEERLKDLERVK